MKSARERMHMIAAYLEIGTYRGAAALCGTTHHTVKREVLRRLGGEEASPKRTERAKNTDIVADLVTKRVNKTQGRISAKRLLPEAKAEGYSGSARNFRRLVAKVKRDRRDENHRGRRPGVWTPGETLVIDWGSEDGLHVFCAVAAWSRFRFVRFATDERSETTLGLLAECFEALEGVPKVVLADRMGCLRADVVANVVVPTPDYVRFATHYGFKPDFCEGGDPASKGIVEHLVGYAKSDLLVPQDPFVDVAAANRAAKAWCEEVNATEHSDICAVPAERLEVERSLFTPLPSLRARIGKLITRKVDGLSCVRFASARYSVPLALIAKTVEVHVAEAQLRVVHLGVEMAVHDLVAAGETSVCDDHYGGPRPAPRRTPRPRTQAEHSLIALGAPGVAFLKGAAAAGSTKLSSELPAIVALGVSHGHEALVAALERAAAFGRFRLADVRSILAAGAGTPRPTSPGHALVMDLPVVPVRPLSDYAPEVAR